MGISDSDYKLLWGRAAGICSNSACREDLTVMLQGAKSYNIGEMAHVIAKHTGGPRGVPEGGSDGYENLILLCPTCHRKIDKAPPGVHSEQMLHSWKREHEATIRQLGSSQKFGTSAEMKEFVSRLLAENRVLWQQLGPQSPVALSDPGSNLHLVWHLRKLDAVIPNNRKIINAIEANSALLGVTEFEAFLAFKVHAQAFEAHQYQRLDSYPLFPSTFTDLFTP
ncbi:HNH endonuclease signature motif containing protein [Nitrosospira sp. NpAV]|uniref:HNH endonuclease signature motif containing protein n=1 Tax=Nitrosospira sp. NpAV TaxID=58133 RepID=UPI00059FA11B|nr:HNH endonuclease signature motif containing protein [Nitrosospira sp. NpAV]KIO48417.1 hypothetical protein SQ11_11795 [Nitrosospira sp. NpAV]